MARKGKKYRQAAAAIERRIRAYLRHKGKPLTETWISQFFPGK